MATYTKIKFLQQRGNNYNLYKRIEEINLLDINKSNIKITDM